jgi:hypothetical protein
VSPGPGPGHLAGRRPWWQAPGAHAYVPRHAATGRWRATWRSWPTRARVSFALATGALVVASLAGSVAFVAPGGTSSAGTGEQASDAPGTDPAASGSRPPAAPGPGDAVAVPSVERPARPTGAPAFAVPPPSAPVEVEVPAIGVRSRLVGLRLDEDGALEAPEDFARAGWFVDGPQPGQAGPAVVAGHVDSQDGPAVFFRLADLAAGDEVLVHREDGSTVAFRVDRVEQHPKDAFPTESVYGPVPGPELRLITCGGEFDEAVDSYRDNIVVYASAAPA